MSTPMVFFDLAGPDVEALHTFYAGVFGWEITPGPFPDTRSIAGIPVRAPLPGTIRKDPSDGSPQSMPNLIYFGVDDVAATLARIEAHGGAIHAPRFEVPGVVVLGLFKDPAGKPMGLVEMQDGKPKVP
ncbi:MAG: VOC family protein [Caulobacteraceae bacterium]